MAMKIKNPQGTTLREFGFEKICDIFERMSWASDELKRRIKAERTALRYKYVQSNLL